MKAFNSHVVQPHRPGCAGHGNKGEKTGDRQSTVAGGTPVSDVAHVLGMTVSSNSALTSNPTTGVIAYPAGSMLILLDSVKKKQSSCIICPGKMITALNFSPDGKLLVIGESGHKAQVRVWRMDTMQEVATFGQFTCIECVSFVPTMRGIVVVGNTYDMIISVWSWPRKTMLSLNKFSDNISAMSVSDDGSFFVTVGNRHIKFYCMEFPRALGSSPVPLPTKSVVLEVLTDTYLCDVVCGKKRNTFIFALSASGILCQISCSRFLERWADVGTNKVHCLATDNDFVFVGCKGGEIRMFTAFDLQFVTQLPQPHSLGMDISQCAESTRKGNNKGDGLAPSMKAMAAETADETGGGPGSGAVTTCVTKTTPDATAPKSIVYPSVKAMVYDRVHHSLAGIYDDCSIYIWRRTGKYFHKAYSSLFHCGCIWDFTIYPLPAQENRSSDETQGGALPPGSLITVSADGTLRSWDVTSNISVDSTLKRNQISSDCLKIVYASACQDPANDKKEASKHGKHQIYSSLYRNNGAVRPCLAKEGRDVLSVVAVCPDGLHIATGNRRGQICIYDAYSMDSLTTMVAHEAEVTVITYTNSRKYKILASGSRDRMIHLMDAANNYQLMSTLDDHSSTITAIHFTYVKRYLIMVSSSLDMSVLARTYIDDWSLSFSHVRAIVEKKAVVDFTLHPWSGQIALVCQDKMVHIENITRSQESYSYRGCTKDGGQLVKINTDPSGLYILTACTKKTINLIVFETGEILKTFCGHAEGVTRVQFSLNMKYVISSSSDGCIFFWRLPVTVAYSVKLVMAEMGLLTRGMVLGEQWKKSPPRRKPPLTRKRKIDLETTVSCDIRETSSCTALPSALEKAAGQPSGEGDGQTSPRSLRLVKSECKITPPASPEMWISPNFEPVKDKIHSYDNLNKLLENDGVGSCLRNNNLDTLMTTCCRRRELFKLEARSIKRVLTMMRMVADAMEKDLQDGGFPSAADLCASKSPKSSNEDSNCNKAPTSTRLSTSLSSVPLQDADGGGGGSQSDVTDEDDDSDDDGGDVEGDNSENDEDDQDDDNITQRIMSLADYLVMREPSFFGEPPSQHDRSGGSHYSDTTFHDS